jgi:hypothetical protein
MEIADMECKLDLLLADMGENFKFDLEDIFWSTDTIYRKGEGNWIYHTTKEKIGKYGHMVNISCDECTHDFLNPEYEECELCFGNEYYKMSLNNSRIKIHFYMNDLVEITIKYSTDDSR